MSAVKVSKDDGRAVSIERARELHAAGRWHACHWIARRDGSGWTCQVCDRQLDMPGVAA